MRAFKKLIPVFSSYGFFFESPQQGSRWENFVLTSSQVPAEDNMAGIYAVLDPEDVVLRDYEGILVVLDCWGVIVEHERGIRAEHARIVAWDEGGFAYFRDLHFHKWSAEGSSYACRLGSRRAYEYAECCGADNDTRAVACGDPWAAVGYARDVDRCPRDDTRAAACKEPMAAVGYARDVDKRPRNDTRAAACGDPRAAVEYAKYIDRCPRDDTRAAACGYPFAALEYAREVDKQPRDDTRAAACGDPLVALAYIREVDKEPRDNTRAAVRGDKYAEMRYNEHFGAGYSPTA